MPRLAAITLTLVLTFSTTAWRAEQESDWTDADTADENRGDVLYNSNEVEQAEAIYREVLDRHPYSATALLQHVKALNAQRRTADALDESRRAVELDPSNALAHVWVGIELLRLGLTNDAIDALQKSQALKPGDETTTIWLSQALRQNGHTAQADTMIDTLLQGKTGEQQIEITERIADCFYEVGDNASALTWWRRSYELGSPKGARWLAWGYDNGIGAPSDEGNSAYWSRRTDDPPFAWFPRLSFADALVGWANGWGLVLIILISTVLLPWLTIGLVALCIRRGLTTDPSVHWSERARLSYPFQIFLGFSVIILPLIYAAGSNYYPSFFLPVPKSIFFWVVFATGFVTCNFVVVRWARCYRPDAGTALQNMQDIGTMLLIYMPTFFIFIIMATNLPGHWGWHAALVIAAGIITYFLIHLGGWIWLASRLRLIVPADAELNEDAAAVARRWGRPGPKVWIIRWRKSNAFAFPFSNSIVVTDTLRALLSRDELSAVLAHELAHLCEDRVTRAMRLFIPLLLVPLFTVSLWPVSTFWPALGIAYFILMGGLYVLRTRTRRMEERADSFGKEAERGAGEYPLALAKLYQANFVPAVMPGKRKSHPHLYDRLLAAGITPDYPRPKPPGRWGLLAALLTIAANLICLTAIWLALF